MQKQEVCTMNSIILLLTMKDTTQYIIVPPKEMLLSFSIGTFLTNYDIKNRTLDGPNVLHYTKTNNLRAK